jgi:hypothetical protein
MSNADQNNANRNFPQQPHNRQQVDAGDASTNSFPGGLCERAIHGLTAFDYRQRDE